MYTHPRRRARSQPCLLSVLRAQGRQLSSIYRCLSFRLRPCVEATPISDATGCLLLHSHDQLPDLAVNRRCNVTVFRTLDPRARFNGSTVWGPWLITSTGPVRLTGQKNRDRAWVDPHGPWDRTLRRMSVAHKTHLHWSQVMGTLFRSPSDGDPSSFSR